MPRPALESAPTLLTGDRRAPAASSRSPTPVLLRPGQIVGSYQIIGLLGRGAMGEVFAASHRYIDRRAAIKVLNPALSRNPSFASSFLNEARAINLVRHPGVVEIYEYDLLADGSAYLVMEMLDGETLAHALARPADIPLIQILSMAVQIADALQVAHGSGVIHRDLKPENVMILTASDLDHWPRVKLLDFGLARIAQEHGHSSPTARPGTTAGTPAYMSPEQWRGAPDIGDRADVYSFGVMLFEMLARRLPFEAAELRALAAQHLHAPPPRLLDLCPLLPAELALLLHDMLGKVSSDRPAMSAVLARLQRVTRIVSGTARSQPEQTRLASAAWSRGALLAHSGSAPVVSRPTLPERPLLRVSGEASKLPQPRPAEARILVISAEPDYRDRLGHALQAEGFACSTTPASDDVLRLAQELHPELILLDAALPGKSGFRLCWEIKSSEPTRDVPVVLVSADSSDADHSMAVMMRADALISKPFELDELLSVIRLLLSEPD